MLVIPRFKILFVHIHKNAGKTVKAFLHRSAAKAVRRRGDDLIAKSQSGILTRLSRSLFPFRPWHLPEDKLVYIRTWRGEDVYGHESLANLLQMYPEFRSFMKLAVVRNPWDRLASAYFWVQGKPSGSSGLNSDDLSHVNSFDQFVREIYATYQRFKPENKRKHPFHSPKTIIDFSGADFIYPSQTAYLTDTKGKVLTDILLRQEHLQGDLVQALSPLMGLEPNQFPRLTRVGPSSRPLDYTQLYSDETKSMVAEIYAPDIELFGYGFKNSG